MTFVYYKVYIILKTSLKYNNSTNFDNIKTKKIGSVKLSYSVITLIILSDRT